MTKRLKLALMILLIAAIATGSSVLLLSGSGNGYESVFKAGVKSLTQPKSYTVKARVTGFVNGEKELDEEFIYLMNGSDNYDCTIDHMTNDKILESYELDGMRYYNIDHENKEYDAYTLYSNSAYQAIALDDSGTENETLVRIVKLFADFYMGNAKNQFVREHIDGGNRYVITLKKEQLPELALLMLDFFNESGDTLYGMRDTYMRVYYEDMKQLLRDEHLLRTGKEMDERVFDLRSEDEALRDAYSAFYDEVDEKYQAIGEAVYEVGAMFVEADGTYEIYPSTKDMYIKRLSEGKQLLTYQDAFDYPQNLDIKYVHGEFDVSDEGYITRIFVSGEGSVQDVTGKTYAGVIEANVDLTGYNETTIDASPISGYTERVQEEKSYKTEDVTETVEFLGVTYEISYTRYVEE